MFDDASGKVCGFLYFFQLLQKAYQDFGLKPAGKSWIFCDPYDYLATLTENNITEDFYQKHIKKTGHIMLLLKSHVSGQGL